MSVIQTDKAILLTQRTYILYYHNNCYYLAPGGGCEVLFSPGLSVCLSVCVCVCVCVCVSVCLCICVSGQYFGILFLGY